MLSKVTWKIQMSMEYKLYMLWKWFDLSCLKIFRTSSEWFSWKAKCGLLNRVPLFYFWKRIFLWIVELGLGLNASILNCQAHFLVCKKFQINGPPPEDVTGNSRARSKTECLYFCFCQVNLLWWLADFIEYPIIILLAGWIHSSLFTFYQLFIDKWREVNSTLQFFDMVASYRIYSIINVYLFLYERNPRAISFK